MNKNLDFSIDQDDLLALFTLTGSAYGNITFESWAVECRKSYTSYFNNKELFNRKQYTFSQYVNAQTVALTQCF